MTKEKWLGLFIGFVGYIPILLHQSSEEFEISHTGIFSLAEIAVIGGAISSVIGWVTMKSLVENKGMPISLANATSMIVGGIITLICSFLFEDWSPTPIKSLPSFLKWSTLLLVTSNLICYNMYAHLLKRFSATFISLCSFSSPLFASLYGWFLLNESVSIPFFISYIIIFIGLYFFYQEELKYFKIKKA
jgi:drug/metabolite transporter (DMT)-like permease